MMKSFFENRRLRRDLRTADKVHMDQLDEISGLKKDISRLVAENNEQQRILKGVKSDLTKVRKQVRDQTGADLLVNALRELGVVPKPNNHTDHFKEGARLQQLAQQQHNALGQQGSGHYHHPFGNGFL
jgi:hypothetical protein